MNLAALLEAVRSRKFSRGEGATLKGDRVRPARAHHPGSGEGMASRHAAEWAIEAFYTATADAYGKLPALPVAGIACLTST
jgi:hypothetical protein